MNLPVLSVDDWPHRHQAIGRFLQASGINAGITTRYGPDAVTDDDLAAARVVFLDHDMCQQRETSSGLIAQEGPCPNPRDAADGENCLNRYCGCPTGMDMVDRLIAGEARPKVIVHTQNGPAGDEMVRRLRGAGFDVHRCPAPRLTRLTAARALAAEMGLR